MTIKTYGVPGLSEWHGKLKVGSIEVNVSFVGGTASPSGAQPAYFMTKDPITQFVIEHSHEYKSGKIITLKKQEIEGDHPRMAKPKEIETTKTETNNTKGVQLKEGKATAETTDEENHGEATGENTGDGTAKVKVADKSEAIEWLKEHYPEAGYTATKLRTEAAFTAACKERGVEFVYEG